MKVILDIHDEKVAFVMELLSNLPFVKTKQISPYKALVLEELNEAVENMKQVKEGTVIARPASELLNEL